MKISKLKIKNIKCFEEIEIPFENDNNDITNWSLIVGDNGAGKTTILRSLALGLCDAKGASALLSELYGDFLRQDTNKGEIEVTLKDTQNNKYTITTKIEGDNEAVSQTTNPEITQNIRRKISAVAYGASRSIMGTESYNGYALIDSLYSLFNYDASLQNAELGARRIKGHNSGGEWEKTQKILKKVLMFDESDEISIETTGLYVKKNDTGKISFNVLCGGYQALSSVILDFLSWKLLAVEEGGFDLNNLSGIFILDEIEQHLHPRWQRNIIKLLSEQFPDIQFICTTHTPICALGLHDLDCTSQLVKVSYDNSHSSIDFFNLKDEFKGYRADQILTSDIFGLSDTRSISIENKLEEYRKIYLKSADARSTDESKKLQSIEEELGELPMWENEEDKKTREELIELLKTHKNEIAN